MIEAVPAYVVPLMDYLLQFGFQYMVGIVPLTYPLDKMHQCKFLVYAYASIVPLQQPPGYQYGQGDQHTRYPCLKQQNCKTEYADDLNPWIQRGLEMRPIVLQPAFPHDDNGYAGKGIGEDHDTGSSLDNEFQFQKQSRNNKNACDDNGCMGGIKAVIDMREHLREQSVTA